MADGGRFGSARPLWVGNKSASSTISVLKKQNCEELEFWLVLKKMVHLIIIAHVFICFIFISVFQFFLYRWHWVCGYACDFCFNIGVRVVKLHKLIKSKHNSVKDINHLQSKNITRHNLKYVCYYINVFICKLYLKMGKAKWCV